MLKIKKALDAWPVVNTQNLQKAEDFIVNVLRAQIVHLSKSNHQINVQANAYVTSTLAVWFCAYGAPIALEFPEDDIYRIQFHVRGVGATEQGDAHYAVTPSQAVITRSSTRIHYGPGYEQIGLRFNRASLEKKIMAISGMPIVRPLAFQPVFDPHAAKTGNLKRTLRFLLCEANTAVAKAPALVLNELEQTLATSLVCLCPNNYSEALQKKPAELAPAQVRLIESYIETHWDQPIHIEDMVAVSGCSARSIYRAFQQSRGFTPKVFLKQVRLNHAQQMLLTHAYKTVTEVALICGFSDLGRFSQIYHHMFGELPSVTLKRRINIRKEQSLVAETT